MAGWQDILSNFKEQFQAVGPEKYSGIENPDLRYELASKRAAGAKAGAEQAAGVISHNVQESQKAAESAAAAKKAKGYTKAYNKSGGFDFLDPDGNKVSPFEFALANGVPLTQALQGSYDPRDQQFVEDYSAMSDDLANGRYDNNTAIQKLAQDYPMVFGMQGGGQNTYREDKKQSGLQSIQAEYGNVKKMGLFSSKKNAIGGDKGANNLFKQFYDKVGSLQSYDDAGYLMNQLRTTKQYQKLNTSAKEDLEKRIGTIADTMFPYAQARYKQSIGLF